MVQKTRIRSYRLNSHQNCHKMAESKESGEKLPQICWSTMTQAEKVLLFLLLLALSTLLALSIFIVAHFLNERSCDADCIEVSYKLLKTLDFDTKPCEDFHQFVCSKYIPFDEESKEDLIITDLQTDDDQNLATVKSFYQACTNFTEIEEDNDNTLFTLLFEIGGWPLLMGNKWKEKNFNWLNFMENARKFGIKSDWLLSFDYYQDEDGTNLLRINPPKLQRANFEEDIETRLDFYDEIVAQIAKKLQAHELVQGQLKQMMEFEDKLYVIAEEARKKLDDENETKNIKVNASTMNDQWPENLPFEILSGLANYAGVNNSTTIVIASPNYLYQLYKLLMEFPRRTQANYFFWKIIEIYLPYTSDDIREIYSEYVELPSREEHCHAETVRRFYSSIERENVRKFENNKTTTLLNSMIDLIYRSFIESEDVTAEIVIEGPEGENSGVTDFQFNSNKIVRMINEIQFHIDNQFYQCLYQKSDSCTKEDYYNNVTDFETFFDTSDNTMHLPYSLVYGSSTWDQPNYINFAQMGPTMGDNVISAEEEKQNTTFDKIGVNLAYEGYMRWLQFNGMEKRLSVLDYSLRQLFWIHSGLFYCSEDDSSKFEDVKNSQYFRKDFEC